MRLAYDGFEQSRRKTIVCWCAWYQVERLQERC